MGTLVPIGLPEISAGSDRLMELKDPDRPVRCAAVQAPLPSGVPGDPGWKVSRVPWGRLGAGVGRYARVTVGAGSPT
jgi:hypothetical protein